MTLDFALKVPSMRDVDLWRECRKEPCERGNPQPDWRYIETPEHLREQALNVLALEVERLRHCRQCVESCRGDVCEYHERQAREVSK